jgi:hypothetical protein
MGIQRLTPKGNIDRAIENRLELMKQSMYNTLSFVGETCVNYAREHGSYKDQSGNLRSSIGYAVIDNGQVITSNGFKGGRGASQGEDFLQEIISRYSSGLRPD